MSEQINVQNDAQAPEDGQKTQPSAPDSATIQPCEPCENITQARPVAESKRFLVVYVVGLFSMALVLIILSFMTQIDNDREVLSLSQSLTATQSALEEQRTAVAGAQGEVAQLQQTVADRERMVQEHQEMLQNVADVMGVAPEINEIVGEWQQTNDQLAASDLLSLLGVALVSQDDDAAAVMYAACVETFGENGELVDLTTAQMDAFTVYQQAWLERVAAQQAAQDVTQDAADIALEDEETAQLPAE